MGVRPELADELIAALQSGSERFRAGDGTEFGRDEMRAKLQELIPAEVIVMRIRAARPSVVIAAPHVSYDNWTQYFANRLAGDLDSGEVLARNFRDDDKHVIPVSIGRHIHVNRPTESARRHGAEIETERAREVFGNYVAALETAGGGLPLDLLIELHGHRAHAQIEVATTGISAAEAATLKQRYDECVGDLPDAPALLIEPLDSLRYAAQQAKQSGSLQRAVCARALHIELPRRCREREADRERMRPVLSEWLRRSISYLLAQN